MENGKTYSGASAVNDMASDFSADVLTPQLLKPALTKVRMCAARSFVVFLLLHQLVFLPLCKHANCPSLLSTCLCMGAQRILCVFLCEVSFFMTSDVFFCVVNSIGGGYSARCNQRRHQSKSGCEKSRSHAESSQFAQKGGRRRSGEEASQQEVNGHLIEDL